MAASEAALAPAAAKEDHDRFFMCSGKRIEIRDVWSGAFSWRASRRLLPVLSNALELSPADTLESEMEIIRSLVPKYKYVAMVRGL